MVKGGQWSKLTTWEKYVKIMDGYREVVALGGSVIRNGHTDVHCKLSLHQHFWPWEYRYREITDLLWWTKCVSKTLDGNVAFHYQLICLSLCIKPWFCVFSSLFYEYNIINNHCFFLLILKPWIYYGTGHA